MSHSADSQAIHPTGAAATEDRGSIAPTTPEATISTGTAGRARAVAIAPRTGTSSKVEPTSGIVAIVAASEYPNPREITSAGTRARLPSGATRPTSASMRPRSRGSSAAIPSTAANESWNDSVPTERGSSRTIAAPANAIAGNTLR